MPMDFSRVEVALGMGVSPVVVAGVLVAAGTVAVVADPGTTQYARARAIDRSGNASAWSASASVVVASVLDDPALADAIANGFPAVIAANSIIAGSFVAGAIVTDDIRAGAITVNKFAAGAIDTAMLTVGNIGNAVIIDGSGVTISDGNPLNPHQVTISNSRLSFKADGADVAYIDSEYHKMFATQVEITDTLKVGFHQIEKYSSNITLVRWVG